MHGQILLSCLLSKWLRVPCQHCLDQCYCESCLNSMQVQLCPPHCFRPWLKTSHSVDSFVRLQFTVTCDSNGLWMMFNSTLFLNYSLDHGFPLLSWQTFSPLPPKKKKQENKNETYGPSFLTRGYVAWCVSLKSIQLKNFTYSTTSVPWIRTNHSGEAPALF